MLFITVCLCLLGYCFILTKYSHFSIETTPFFVLSSVILLLYIFAYTHLLPVGAYIILGVGGASLLYSFAIFYKERCILLKRYFTPGFVLWLGLCLVMLLIASHGQLSTWDEFGFWAKFSKFVFHNHGFITAKNAIGHKTYPPGSPLFYYLFFSVSGFRESTMLMARQFFLLCPVLAMLRAYSWKDWRFVLIYFIGIFILLYYVLHFMKAPLKFWDTLYVDLPIGFFLGGILVQYRISRRNLISILTLIPAIAVLFLLKIKLGAAVALILIFIVGDQLLQGIRAVKRGGRKKINWQLIVKRGLGILLLFGAVWLISFSWSRYYTLYLHDIAERQLPHLTLPMIWDILTVQNLSSFHLGIVNHFYHAVRLPLAFSIIFFLSGFLIIYFNKTKKGRYFLVLENLVLFIGALLTLLGFLLSYLYVFGPREGPALASFYRYVSIYYIAWFLLLYNCLFSPILYRKLVFKNKSQWIILIVLGIFSFGIASSFHAHRKSTLKNVLKMRGSIQTITDPIKIQIPSSAKIMLIWQEERNLFPTSIMDYELWPRTVIFTALDQYRSDTRFLSVQKTQQLLKNISIYDYVLLAYTNERFWQYYGKIFPQPLKPYAHYSVCDNDNHDYSGKVCIWRKKNVYLFKVIHTPRGIKLRSIQRV